MKERLRLLLGSLLLACVSLCGYGEINLTEVCGYVVDEEDGHPLSDVVVSVISMPDSVVSGIDVTDRKGRYCVKVGSESDRIRFVRNGWNTVTVAPSSLVAASGEMKVSMGRADTELPEFTVKAKKANMKGKPGMFVFDPGDLSKYVKNAKEILNYVPLLEGPTKIFSKSTSATIYINGEEPSIPQEVLLDKLKSMPPDKIKKVEIIMNPGVEHDRDVLEGGIINIELVDDMIGWNIYSTLTGNYAERRLSSVAPSLVWFYQNHNILLSANASYSYCDRFSSRSGDLFDASTGLNRHITNEKRGHDQSVAGSVTGEYRFGRSSASLALHFSSGELNWRTHDEEIQSVNLTDLRKYISRTSEKSGWHPDLTMGARFLHWIDREKTMQLNISAIIGNTVGKTESLLNVDSEDENGSAQPLSALNQSYDSETFGSGISARLNKRFRDRSVLGVQARFHYETVKQLYTATDDAFDFRRRFFGESLSLSYQRQCTEWFSFRAGVREEYLVRSIMGEDGEYVRKNFLLFYPNASLSFNLHGGLHNINADWYAYPSFPADFQLNPHKTWTSATSYTQGNPDIPITVCHRVTLQYGFLSNYFLSVGYRTGKTSTSSYIYLDDDSNKVSSYLMNQRYNDMDADFNYSKDFFDYRWRLWASCGLTWRNSSADFAEGKIASHSVNYNFSLGSHVTLSRRYGLTVSGNYRWQGADRELTRSVSGKHILYFSLSKDLWEGADVGANMTVPLNKVKTTLSNASSLSDMTVDKYWRDISASVTFTWRFGKMSIDRVSQIEL